MIEITDRKPSPELLVVFDGGRQRLRNHLLEEIRPRRLLVRGYGNVQRMILVLSHGLMDNSAREIKQVPRLEDRVENALAQL